MLRKREKKKVTITQRGKKKREKSPYDKETAPSTFLHNVLVQHSTRDTLHRQSHCLEDDESKEIERRHYHMSRVGEREREREREE
jgi:hypothetical protein